MIKLLKAKWLVGHVDGRYCLYEDGEIAVSGDSALFVGKRFPGTPDKVVDYGNALIGPGFIDLDAVSDLGRLQPGAKADLIVVDFDDPFMGQTIDPIQTLLLNATARSIRSVMINGRFVMEDGVIPGIDDHAYRQSAQAQFDGLVAKYPMRTLGHPPLHEIFSSSYRRLS